MEKRQPKNGVYFIILSAIFLFGTFDVFDRFIFRDRK